VVINILVMMMIMIIVAKQ